MPQFSKRRSFYLALAIIAGVVGAALCTGGAMLLSPRIVRAYGPEIGLYTVFGCFLIGMIAPAILFLKIADRIAPAGQARNPRPRWVPLGERGDNKDKSIQDQSDRNEGTFG